jgi:excisionase family DNA binding protein
METYPEIKKPLLKAKDVAKQLNISISYVYKLINSKQLSSVSINNAKRIRQEDLNNFINENLSNE